MKKKPMKSCPIPEWQIEDMAEEIEELESEEPSHMDLDEWLIGQDSF